MTKRVLKKEHLRLGQENVTIGTEDGKILRRVTPRIVQITTLLGEQQQGLQVAYLQRNHDERDQQVGHGEVPDHQADPGLPVPRLEQADEDAQVAHGGHNEQGTVN